MTSTAETQFAKCRCSVCNASIEFPIEDAGRTATCPHCGMETELFIPISHTATSVHHTTTQLPGVRWYRHPLLKIAVCLALAGLLACFIWVAFSTAPVAQVGAGIGGMVVLVLGGLLLLIWAVLWIVFPVFVYFGMNRMEKLLRQIERNTRRPS